MAEKKKNEGPYCVMGALMFSHEIPLGKLDVLYRGNLLLAFEGTIEIMGHYQEDGIGVKGFTNDRGSIPKESPPRPRGRSLRDQGGLLRDAPEVMRKSRDP